jgi:HK97 family phage portal protein
MAWWRRRRVEERSFQAAFLDPGMATHAGITVTPDSALRLAACWSCIRLLSDTVSGLPVDAYRQGSRTPIEPKPALLVTPAAYTSFADWAYQVMVSALTRGNAYGLVTARTGAAERPSQIELLSPDRVMAQVDLDQRTVTWRLDGQPIDREDLWHFRAYPLAGSPIGLSPIEYARETVAGGLAAQRFGNGFFNNDGTPAGLLTSDQRIGEEAAEALHARWQKRHQGRRGIAVLGGGARFQPVSIRPDESQFLDAQRFTVQQVARIYGVAPEMIGADSGNAMTYTNLEQRSLDFLVYGVGPWLGRLETALTDLLPRNTYVKFNTGALLRTDLKTRYESYKLALEGGWLTLDEIRELEDREPLPPAEPGGAA